MIKIKLQILRSNRKWHKSKPHGGKCPKCKSLKVQFNFRFEYCLNCFHYKDYHNWNHNEPDFI